LNEENVDELIYITPKIWNWAVVLSKPSMERDFHGLLQAHPINTLFF
jgi:hypothetical protein